MKEIEKTTKREKSQPEKCVISISFHIILGFFLPGSCNVNHELSY